MSWMDRGNISKVYAALGNNDCPHKDGLAAHCIVCVTIEGEKQDEERHVQKWMRQQIQPLKDENEELRDRVERLELLIEQGGPGRGNKE